MHSVLYVWTEACLMSIHLCFPVFTWLFNLCDAWVKQKQRDIHHLILDPIKWLLKYSKHSALYKSLYLASCITMQQQHQAKQINHFVWFYWLSLKKYLNLILGYLWINHDVSQSFVCYCFQSCSKLKFPFKTFLENQLLYKKKEQKTLYWFAKCASYVC